MESLNYYFKNSLDPIFKEVTELFIKEKERPEKLITSISWSSFYRNSLALFEVLGQANCTDQFAMTLRLLMEISADMHYIEKNRNNIDTLTDNLNHAMHKVILDKISYADVAKIAKGLHIYNSKGEETHTIDRIDFCYNEKRFKSLYDYYCCYSHYNTLASVFSVGRSHNGDKSILRHSMYLLSFYVDIFEKEIIACGKILNNQKLVNYNFAKIKNAIDRLIIPNTKSSHILS